MTAGNQYPRLELLTKELLGESVALFMDTFSKEPWYDQYESEQQVVDYFQAFMQSSDYLGYVLMVANKIEAVCLGLKTPSLEGTEYFIHQFCVNYNNQGQGLGKVFLELIEEDVKKAGLYAVILTTSKEFPAKKFYEANGYHELETTALLAKEF